MADKYKLEFYGNDSTGQPIMVEVPAIRAEHSAEGMEPLIILSNAKGVALETCNLPIELASVAGFCNGEFRYGGSYRTKLEGNKEVGELAVVVS